MNRENLLLYAVTNRHTNDFQQFYEQVEASLIGGVTCLQLREKNLSKLQFVEMARIVKKICNKYNVPLIINDYIDVAIEINADGVHVGVNDLPVKEIRQMVDKNFIIGATAKTIEQAQKAEIEGADYLGVGAIFDSPTKQNAIRITKKQLNDICESVKIPAIAIGGINIGNISDLEKCKISGIAVSSSIFAAENILEMTKLLKQKITKQIGY